MRKYYILWLVILASLMTLGVVRGNNAAALQIGSTPSIPPANTDTPAPTTAPTDPPTLAPTDPPATATFPPPPTFTPIPPTFTPIPPTNTPLPTATRTFFFFPTRTRFFQTRTPTFTLPPPTLTFTPLPSLTATKTFTPTSTVTGTPIASILDPSNPPTPAQPALDPAILRNLKAGTMITLVPPTNVSQGEPFILSGTLHDWSGGVVVNAGIIFTLNGSYLAQTRTDANGFFQQKVNKPLDAGIYTVTASFNGTHNLAYSTAAATLNVSPAEVRIQTIPPVPGVTFQLNGQQFVTGDDGIASIKVEKAGTYRLEALISLYNDPTQRIEFGRWLEDNYQPFTNVEVPVSRVIQVGLNVYNRVGETFVDLDGNRVDPQRIAQFTIRSEQGDTFVFNNGEPRWLIASRIARRVDGLQVTKLLYSVLNVKLDGSNVVNESQQQFYAEPNDTWKISLLLYSLKIRVSDGLFGSATGKSVNLLFPNGQINNYPLDPTGQVEIHGLARGNYSIEVAGTKGLGNKMPVALSRNQDANIKVLTYTDLGIVGILGFLMALALLFYGRRSLFLSSLRRRQRTVRRAGNALMLADDIQPAEQQGKRPKDELIKWS